MRQPPRWRQSDVALDANVVFAAGPTKSCNCCVKAVFHPDTTKDTSAMTPIVKAFYGAEIQRNKEMDMKLYAPSTIVPYGPRKMLYRRLPIAPFGFCVVRKMSCAMAAKHKKSLIGCQSQVRMKWKSFLPPGTFLVQRNQISPMTLLGNGGKKRSSSRRSKKVNPIDR